MRTSKIARLPKAIRNEISLRLEDGGSYTPIVMWLNELPEVKKLILEQFRGHPISEQNLSDWKQSGHQDWLRRQEAQEAARDFLNDAEELNLNDPDQRRRLLDNFGAMLAIELNDLARQFRKEETDKEKRDKRLERIGKQLAQLRRDNDRSTRLTLLQERQKHQIEREKREDARVIQKEDKRRLERMLQGRNENDLVTRSRFQGDPNAREKIELVYRLDNDLPIGDLLDPSWREVARTILFHKPNPTSNGNGSESKGIQANQT